MTQSRSPQISCLSRLAPASICGALALALACTPATPDDTPTGMNTSNNSASSAGGGAGAGSVGSAGAPASGSGGSSGAGAGPSAGGAAGTAGSPVGNSGGSAAGGSTNIGTGGAAGAIASNDSGISSSGGSGGSASSGGVGGSAGSAGTASQEAGTTPAGCDWNNATGRIVLFDGTSLAQWANQFTGGPAQWRLIGDGTMEVVPLEPPTNIVTKQLFEDLCVHVEYMTPTYPSSVTGQDRGNSGVYLKRAYEMQILDSIGQPPDINTCGAVYSVRAPLVVACNKELVWNTYEIEFKSSLWDAGGRKTQNAMFVAATLNGKLVQSNVELNPAGGFTQAGEPDRAGPQSLMLQDHRNLIRFRNIWVKAPHY